MDITSLDCISLNGLKRFELVYSFKSSLNFVKLRFFIRFSITKNIIIPSLSYIYSSSLWLEREL
jgi:NADH:ubiquinone oxidoreductase subunit C